MVSETIKNEIYELIEGATVSVVCSVDQNGFPNAKGMLALHHDGMGIHYFSTNYSARRTRHFIDNPSACVYIYREPNYRGVMLIGTIEVCTDAMHKELLWRDGFEMYYSQGVTDPDYCVLKFTAQRGNYYHGLQNHDFDIRELES